MLGRSLIAFSLLLASFTLLPPLRAQETEDEPAPKKPAAASELGDASDEEATTGVSAMKPNKNGKKGGPKEPEPPPLPDDSRLLKLHKEFVTKAEKLASEYEHNKQGDKAAAVYGEILKLVPAYPKAKQALEAYRQKENTSDHKVFVVKANEDWQDTGIRLIAGKPMHIVASGTWKMNMSAKLSADGMDPPKQAKEFKLGSLVGLIVTGGDLKKAKAFSIGSDAKLNVEQSGALLVKMYSGESNEENEGSLRLEFTGRFETKGK